MIMVSETDMIISIMTSAEVIDRVAEEAQLEPEAVERVLELTAENLHHAAERHEAVNLATGPVGIVDLPAREHPHPGERASLREGRTNRCDGARRVQSVADGPSILMLPRPPQPSSHRPGSRRG